MSAASKRIGAALKVGNQIAYRSEPNTSGMTRGWFMGKPAGGWTYLGASEAEVMNDIREQEEYRADFDQQQRDNATR